MAGTKAGGLKAAAKNLAKDPNFYSNIGKKGGMNGTNGGFASDIIGEDGLTGKQRARIAGAKGGAISRRKGPIAPVRVEKIENKNRWDKFFNNVASKFN